KKTALDEGLRRRERLVALMERRDNIGRMLKEAEGRRDRAEADLRRQMSGAWHAILRERIRTMMKQLRERERALSFARMRSYLVEQAPDDCPTCLRPLPSDVVARIKAAVAAQGEDEESLTSLQARADALEALGSREGKGLIRVQWSSYELAKMDIQLASDQM